MKYIVINIWQFHLSKRCKYAALTHFLIQHFETVPNTKKLQASTEMLRYRLNIVEKGEIAHFEKFHLFPCNVFIKLFFFNVLKWVFMEERVHSVNFLFTSFHELDYASVRIYQLFIQVWSLILVSKTSNMIVQDFLLFFCSLEINQLILESESWIWLLISFSSILSAITDTSQARWCPFKWQGRCLEMLLLDK